MKNAFSTFVSALMLISIMSCNTPSADNSAADIETIKKFDAAWNTGKVEDAVAVCADDAVITLPPSPGGKSTYTGKAEIEAFGKDLLSGAFHVDSKNFRKEGDKVKWDFTVESDYFKKALGVSPVTGSSEAVVVDGKIKSFSPVFDAETMNKAGALQFFALVDAGKRDEVEKNLFAPDAIIHFPATPNPMTVAEFKQTGEAFATAFPDGKHTVQGQIADGDMVATYMVFTGTNTGPMMGAPATGKPVSTGGVKIDKFSNGKVVESWLYFDQVGMLQQMGVLPAPGKK